MKLNDSGKGSNVSLSSDGQDPEVRGHRPMILKLLRAFLDLKCKFTEKKVSVVFSGQSLNFVTLTVLYLGD